MADGAYPSLADVSAPFQTDAWIALPGVGEFSPEPEYGPIKTSFHAVAPLSVPSQLDADTFESLDWMLSFQRAEAPGLRKGAVVRAAPPDTGVIARWFVEQAVKGPGRDEVRALVKAMAEET